MKIIIKKQGGKKDGTISYVAWFGMAIVAMTPEDLAENSEFLKLGISDLVKTFAPEAELTYED